MEACSRAGRHMQAAPNAELLEIICRRQINLDIEPKRSAPPPFFNLLNWGYNAEGAARVAGAHTAQEALRTRSYDRTPRPRRLGLRRGRIFSLRSASMVNLKMSGTQASLGGLRRLA